MVQKTLSDARPIPALLSRFQLVGWGRTAREHASCSFFLGMKWSAEAHDRVDGVARGPWLTVSRFTIAYPTTKHIYIYKL